MRHDYSSAGFYTFDCLGWPISAIPPGGGTYFIDDLAMAVSGAAGTATIVAAKMGLDCKAVGGVGTDLMGDWVIERLGSFGVETSHLVRLEDVTTSSSIVLTRADGSRPALHLKGATGAYMFQPAEFDALTDATIFHLGGVGLMDAMDGAPNAALMKHAQDRGSITTVDVFAGSPSDLPDVEAVLPHTDYFIPSVEEAEALTGLNTLADMAGFFLGKGAGCCVFTLGEHGTYYHHSDGTIFTEPAFDIDVVCTCGCGDAFNAGFATALIRNMDPRMAVRFAQACSALTASGLGSQAGVTDFQSTMAFMNERPVRISETLAASL